MHEDLPLFYPLSAWRYAFGEAQRRARRTGHRQVVHRVHNAWCVQTIGTPEHLALRSWLRRHRPARISA